MCSYSIFYTFIHTRFILLFLTVVPTSFYLLQGEMVEKTVFVVFYQGEELKSRVKKICAGFHASFYPCPSASSERLGMALGVKARIADLEMVRELALYSPSVTYVVKLSCVSQRKIYV